MRFGEFWQHTYKHPSARLGLNGTLEAINLEIMMTIATPPFSLTIIGALHGDTTLVQNGGNIQCNQICGTPFRETWDMGKFDFCLGRKKPVGVDVWLRVNQSVAYVRLWPRYHRLVGARWLVYRSFPRLQIRHCISEVQVKPRLNAFLLHC